VKILLVEDEQRMAEAIVELLERNSYTCELKTDGTTGLEAALCQTYELLILDVMLPGLSGFEIVREVRRAGNRTPVLMLTARDDVDDKVEGLDAGADDYLTKPFETKELLARIRALTRRNGYEKDLLSFGDIVIHPDIFEISCVGTGQRIQMGQREFRIMEMFVRNQGQILTREQLSVGIFGYENDAEYNNVEVYVSFTRKKLAFIGSKVEIHARRGVGYELKYADEKRENQAYEKTQK
jgi:DNA-binding response OmpR family regulator